MENDNRDVLYTAEQEKVTREQASKAYDSIDRYLRNNMDDDDYADYSAELDKVYAYAATLRQQGGPSLYVGTIDGCPVALHGTSESIARVQAALAQNTQGEAVASVTTGVPNKLPQSLGDHAMQTLAGVYTRAERATVPEPTPELRQRGAYVIWAEVLAGITSQPAEDAK